MNALKHGMAARVPVLPGEDPEAFRRRVEGIVDSLSPRNALELALAEQAALSLWKIERAERAEATRVTATIRATAGQAEAHKQEELHALGRWLLAKSVQAKREAADDLLAFLPEDRHAPFKAGRGEPLTILLRIRGTADGCQWLLWRWDRLEGNGGWDLEEMIEAAQLRGERPLHVEAAEWEGLLQARYARDTAYLEEGRRQLLDQLTDGRAAEGAGLAAALLGLVGEETARLEELKGANEECEATERAELSDRLAVDATPEGERVRRYQLDCDRKLHRAIQGLLKLRRGEGSGDGDDPARDGIPEPEPGSEGKGTVAVPSDPGDGPEGDLVPRHEPTTPANAERTAQNEPSATTSGDRIPQNEPGPPPGGERPARNEPGPAAGGGRLIPHPSSLDRKTNPTPPVGSPPRRPRRGPWPWCSCWASASSRSRSPAGSARRTFPDAGALIRSCGAPSVRVVDGWEIGASERLPIDPL